MNEKNSQRLLKFSFFIPSHPKSFMKHGFACVSENSKILMSDFSMKNIQDIKIGEKIIGVNEKKKSREHYKLVEGTVLNTIDKGRRKCIKIKSVNNELILTPDHEVFSIAWEDHYKWIRAERLVNDRYKPTVFEIFDKNDEYYWGWIIGLLEGDGYVINHGSGNKYIGIKSSKKKLVEELKRSIIRKIQFIAGVVVGYCIVRIFIIIISK